MSAAVMPPRRAVVNVLNYAKASVWSLKVRYLCPAAVPKSPKTKTKTQEVKRETRKRLVALGAGAFSGAGVEGVCRFPALLAVSLLYLWPAY